MAFSAYRGRAQFGCLPFGERDPTYTASSYDLSPAAVKRINITYIFARCLAICAGGQLIISGLVILLLVYEYIGVRYAFLFAPYAYIAYGTYCFLLAAIGAFYAGALMFCLPNVKWVLHALCVYTVGAIFLVLGFGVFRYAGAGRANQPPWLQRPDALSGTWATAQERIAWHRAQLHFGCCDVAEPEQLYMEYASRCVVKRSDRLTAVEAEFCARFVPTQALAEAAAVNGWQEPPVNATPDNPSDLYGRQFFVRHQRLRADPQCLPDQSPPCTRMMQQILRHHMRLATMYAHLMWPNGALCICMLLLCFLDEPHRATAPTEQVEQPHSAGQRPRAEKGGGSVASTQTRRRRTRADESSSDSGTEFVDFRRPR